MRSRLGFTATLLAATLALAGCAGDDLAKDTKESGASGDQGTVRISGQAFPEADLVAQMYAQLLEAQGYTVDIKLVDTRDAYMSTFPKSVDVVPEYVGGIVDFLNTTANGPDADPLTTSDPTETIDAASSLLKDKGITLLDASEATDTNAFFMLKDVAEANGDSALSDLKGRSVVLAAAPDCEGRADCEGGLTDVYGINITKVEPLGFASAQTYQAVIDREADLGLTSTTDGTLDSQGLVLLDDDKQIQPAQNLVPAVSTAFLEEHPDIQEPLNNLMAALTTQNLTELNGRVSVDREKTADVAKDFLTDQGLL